MFGKSSPDSKKSSLNFISWLSIVVKNEFLVYNRKIFRCTLMKKKLAIIGSCLLIQFCFFSSIATPFAQSNTTETATESQLITPSASESTQSESTQQKTTPVEKGVLTRFRVLERIRQELRSSQKDFQSATNVVADAQGKLDAVEEELSTLNEQLNNLDQQIANTQSLIANVNMQIAQKENRLTELHQDMEIKKIAIENQKRMLGEYLKLLYEQENSMSDTFDKNQQVNIAKLLLSDMPVGEQLQQVQYFQILENTGHQLFSNLEKLLTELEQNQKELENEKEKLGHLYERLKEEKNNLDTQREAKANLLEQTKGDEKIYTQLFEQSKQQQAQIQEDMRVLSTNLAFIQAKMDELGDNFNPNDYADLLGKEMVSVADYINSTKTDGFELDWPVKPSRGISAYFHDSSYRGVFGVDHNAVDIRQTQGTPIHAPADGVVYKVRDNGYGYSYLILAHPGGFMTIYGHVSEFLVDYGEKITKGQIVALTGGMPGSKGAGLMTTGAHLHFEVMKGGKYVDPLDYLPLTALPIDTLPSKYLSRVMGEAQKIKREASETNTTNEDATQMIENSIRLEHLNNSNQEETEVASE